MDWKQKLNVIFDQDVGGIKITSKCKFYKDAEKIQNFLQSSRNLCYKNKVHLLEIKGKNIKEQDKKMCILFMKTNFLTTYVYPTESYPII